MPLKRKYQLGAMALSLMLCSVVAPLSLVHANEVCCNVAKQDLQLFHVTDSSFSNLPQVSYALDSSSYVNDARVVSRVNSVQEEALSKFKVLKQDIVVHDRADNSLSSIIVNNENASSCTPCNSSLIAQAPISTMVAHKDSAVGAALSQSAPGNNNTHLNAPVSSPAPFNNIKLLSAPYLDNNQLTSNAYNAVAHLKGQPINAATLQNVLDALSTYYQEQGFVLSKAYLPQQNIEEGLVQVLVANPKFNNFTIENDSLVRDSYLEYLMSGITELSGQEVSAQVLDNQVRKLADLGTFSLFGEASNADPHGFYKDIDFKAAPSGDRFNFALFADNQGNKSAGRYRFGGLVEVQNPTGSADRLQVSYARSNEQQNNYSLSYRLPINSHPTVWGLDLCYSDYELTGIYRQLGAQGKSLSIESYLLEPVMRSQNAMFNVLTGLRYRKLTDEYANFDLQFEKHTWSAYVGTNGFYHQDDWIFNYDAKAYATRVYCDDQYEALEERTYLTLEGVLGLSYSINNNWLARTSLRYQMANDYVDGADSFLAGGDTGLRAYEFGDISGDGGLIWKNELTFFPDFIKDASLSAHIETAKVYNHDYKGESASSAGLTASYQFKGLQAELDWSHGVGTMPVYAQDRSALKFNLSYSF